MPKETKEVAVKTEDYAIVTSSSDPAALSEALRENLDGAGLSVFDLDRIKVPSGGSKTWTVPTMEGEVETQDLQGIIIYNKVVRQYYENPFAGGGQPPECFSNDGHTGIGTPGGDCDSCYLSKFGAGNDGKTACKERRLFFVLLPDSALPVLLNAPPSALKNARTYLLKLSGVGKKYFQVITRFVLTKDKSTDGIDYSKLSFALAGDAPSPAILEAYAKSFRSVVEATPPKPVVAED